LFSGVPPLEDLALLEQSLLELQVIHILNRHTIINGKARSRSR
jgi:hypothetical protein